eukprot:g4375.t1
MGHAVLSNDLLSTTRVELCIGFGFLLGVSFLVVHGTYGKKDGWGERMQKVFVELQRKSFHIIGGCLIASIYHFGVKFKLLSSAYLADTTADASEGRRPLDGAVCLLAISFVCWGIEASRLLFDSINQLYMDSFKGLIREKERTKAAGIAYFLPGSLAAMMAAPENIALLGILFLSIGDTAASIGTAAGSLKVGKSSRMFEGSVGCFLVCTGLGVFMGLTMQVALVTAAVVTTGELLSEVIGLDDNLVIPMLSVVGIRFAIAPQGFELVEFAGVCLVFAISLGAVVGATTGKNQKKFR